MSVTTQSWWSNETAISLAKAAKHYPTATHPSTVYRHATKTNRHGIVLESFMAGGRRLTTLEAVERFVARTTEAANGLLVTPSTFERAAAAEAELDAIL